MAWVELFIAGVFEVAWAIGLKYTHGFSRFWPSVGTVIAMTASFVFLARAVRTLPIGTAYAVWTGVGAVGTVLLGMLLFDEPHDAARLVCIGLILLGIAGLRLASST